MAFNNCGQFKGQGQNGNDFALNAAASAPELKVALIGDTSIGSAFRGALQVARDGGADVIMINGDFVYLDDDEGKDAFRGKAQMWKNILKEEIDVNKIAVIGSLGNHDVDFNDNKSTEWEDQLMRYFDEFRNGSNQLKSKCTGQRGLSQSRDVTLVNEVCTFGNVTIVASSINLFYEHGFTSEFFEKELDKKLLAAPPSNWKLAGYHFTLASMNRANKRNDQNTHEFFDIIRKRGAIGVQAHTHHIMASCSISSPFRKGSPVKCDPRYENDLNNRRVEEGVGLYLDSSAIRDVRPKTACLNNGADCKHMVDVINAEGYSFRDGGAQSIDNGKGVLFLVFNAGGDSSRAYASYQSLAGGDPIFSFNILKNSGGPTGDNSGGNSGGSNNGGASLGATFTADGLYWRITAESDGHCRLRTSDGVDKNNLAPRPGGLTLRYKENWCENAGSGNDGSSGGNSGGDSGGSPGGDANGGASVGQTFTADGMYWIITSEADGHCRLRTSDGVDKNNLAPRPGGLKLEYKNNYCP